MTALDSESGKEIINPYILLTRICTGIGVFLNTDSFANCQSELIHPLDYEKYESLVKNKTCYRVEAVVGEYNGPLPGESPRDSLYLRTVSILRPERSKTLLGFLGEGVIKENLPNSFEHLSKKD